MWSLVLQQSSNILTSLLNFVFIPELIEGIVLTRDVDLLEIKVTLPNRGVHRDTHSDVTYNARHAEQKEPQFPEGPTYTIFNGNTANQF